LLSQGTPQQQQAVLERVRAAPERFQPPVFYVLSQTLFKAGLRDEAAFWFYAGQLRARFDANRCADVTARQAVDVMNQSYGAPINRHLFQDLDKAQELIAKVVDWDRRTPHAYDPHWINLHGMQAVQASRDPQLAARLTMESLSLPAAQWPAWPSRRAPSICRAFRKPSASSKPNQNPSEDRYRPKSGLYPLCRNRLRLLFLNILPARLHAALMAAPIGACPVCSTMTQTSAP
jgi:hypothetical protein